MNPNEMKLILLIILTFIISYKSHSQILIFKSKGNRQVSKPYLDAKKEADKAFKNGKYDLASAYYKTALSYYGATKEERSNFQEQAKKSDKLFDLKLDYLNAKSGGESKLVLDVIKKAILFIHPSSPGIVVQIGNGASSSIPVVSSTDIILPNYLLLAIKYYNNCQFQESYRNLRKAPSNKKFDETLKDHLLKEMDILLEYRTDINKLKQNESQQSGLSNAYRNIIRKLSDINKLDKRFLPCSNFKNYYDEYLIEQINKGKTCDFIIAYLRALEISNITEYNKIEIQKKKKELCEKDTTVVDVCSNKISQLSSIFKVAENNYINCQLEDAKLNLNLAKNYFSNFPKECTFPFKRSKIDSLQVLIDKSLKQNDLITEIKNLYFQNRCKLAYEKSLTIDSTDYCKKTLNLSQIKCCAFRELLDSASRSRELRYYKDCQRFANIAYSLACSKTDSAVAKILFKDCLCKELGNCPKEDTLCDQSRINSKAILIGTNFHNIGNKTSKYSNNTSFSIGFQNDRIKPLSKITIGYLLEFRQDYLKDLRFKEVSIGARLNLISSANCNNKAVYYLTFGLSPTYLFDFVAPSYSVNTIGNENKMIFKIEPQLNLRMEHTTFNIGYFINAYSLNTPIKTQGLNFRLGYVFK